MDFRGRLRPVWVLMESFMMVPGLDHNMHMLLTPAELFPPRVGCDIPDDDDHQRVIKVLN
jgi:hypothetical protein